MKIEISGKKYEIKTASELTVKEYVYFFSGITETSKESDIFIRYISAVTGLDFLNVCKIDIDEHSIRRMLAYVGEIKNPMQLNTIDYFYIKNTGRKLYQKNVNWRSLGTRKMLEDKHLETGLELAVYLLAIYIDGTYDNENIEQIYSDLQNYNAISVFGFVWFFFQKLQNGKKQETNFLKMLMTKAAINTAKLLSKLRAKD